jgi:hypothetical protein
MEYAALPPVAAWQFVDAVNGFEVVYRDGFSIRGHTSAVEAGQAYAVHYEILFDAHWRTREVSVHNDTALGPRSAALVSDGDGSWTVDGQSAPHLDGLYDVDLETSACTNTFPVHRLDLPQGQVVEAPAAYVQALDLQVRRLDQSYRRLDDHRFDYSAEGGFNAVLVYDEHGLVLDYPGIARRVA